MIRAILITALLALGATAWAADGENAIEGIWETDTGGYVQIHKEGDAWVGTVVGSRSGEARYDTENPDEKLRRRQRVGRRHHLFPGQRQDLQRPRHPDRREHPGSARLSGYQPAGSQPDLAARGP